ncbi:hypothetical protein RBB50_005855 [Rhinocladiella similis]
MPEDDLNSLKSRAEVAAAALSSVYAANELGKALTEEDRHELSDHYLRAAIGAAVAVGAFYQLQKKRDRGRDYDHDYRYDNDCDRESGDADSDDEHIDQERREDSRERHHHHHNRNPRYHYHEHSDPPGHGRHLLEEAAGAYSLGKELLGDKRHHVAHLIAEALGAVGAIRDIQGRKMIEDEEHERR